jgi:hypothetical protein
MHRCTITALSQQPLPCGHLDADWKTYEVHQRPSKLPHREYIAQMSTLDAMEEQEPRLQLKIVDTVEQERPERAT